MIGAGDSKIIEKYGGWPTAELWGTSATGQRRCQVTLAKAGKTLQNKKKCLTSLHKYLQL